jgi:Putative prokaryotic signal transducing protein
MKELLRSNNFVYLSYAQAVLKHAGIEVIVFDSHMSVMEGSLGVLPRRLMVADDDVPRARKLLAEAEPADSPAGPDVEPAPGSEPGRV